MRKLHLAFVSLLTVGGCSQVLGLGDYDIDPALDDGKGGSAIAAGGQGGDAPSLPGGAPGQAGEVGVAGQPPQGGAPAGGQPGSAGAGEGGAGGDGSAPFSECRSLKCCEDLGGTPVATSLVPHGDFENEPDDWGTESQYPIFTEETEDTISAHGGTWFAWLGGSTDDISVMLSPKFTIPNDTGWLTLETYAYLVFDSATLTGDFAEVVLYAEDEFDTPAEVFLSWDNAEFNTTSWDYFSADIPVSSYAGQSFYVGVYSVTDALADAPDDQAASNFFFDDMTFTAYSCKP